MAAGTLRGYVQKARSAVRRLRGSVPSHEAAPLLPSDDVAGSGAGSLSRDEVFDRLRRDLDRFNVWSEPMQALLRQLTLPDREEVARLTGSMVQYYGDEVPLVQRAEEEAALRAAPPGYSLERLNGVNVGCGNRAVHPALLNLDAHRGERTGSGAGAPRTSTSLANFCAWADDLPFRTGSVDFVVALHILEHVRDPARTVLHWLDLVKPGGGIGVVVPDWRYTGDARLSDAPRGHRWNPTPELVRELYETHWREVAALESFQTYPYRLSFDFVLRKHGTFEPFDPEAADRVPTGRQLHEAGEFLQCRAA